MCFGPKARLMRATSVSSSNVIAIVLKGCWPGSNSKVSPDIWIAISGSPGAGDGAGFATSLTQAFGKEVEEKIAAKSVKIVINPDYREGMSTSIIAGLKMINEEDRAVMLALGDQPYIDSQTINTLIEVFATQSKGIAVPVYQERRGHPVIFATKYREELLRLKGDIGGREVINRHPEDVIEVDVDCEGVLIDIDDMDSYPSTDQPG